MTTAITTAQHITVLKHLANGRDTDWVATVTKIPQDTVEQLADDAGWPDTDKLVASIENLTRAANTIPEQHRPSITPGSAAPRVAAPRPDLSVARHAPAPPPASVPSRPHVGTSVSELLHLASESHKASTKNLGRRIGGLLADLTQRIHDETTEREAREAAAAEKAKNAKRIAELEAELARLKGHKSSPRAAVKTSAVGGVVNITATACEGDGCDRTFDTIQGLNLHRRKAHGLAALRINDLPQTA